MAVKTYLLGRDAKLYAGIAGSTPNTEILDVRDLSVTLNQGEIDVTTRTAKGWKVSAGGLREATISFDVLVAKDSTEAKIFLQAFAGSSGGGTDYIALRVVDAPDNGILDLDADCLVTECSQTQDLEDKISFSVTCKPTIYDTDRVPTLTIS